MKKLFFITAIWAALTFFPAAILIAGYGHGMFSNTIDDMDTDSDKRITYDEFKNFQIKDLKAAFNMLDTNHDGFIDEAEWNDFIRVHSDK